MAMFTVRVMMLVVVFIARSRQESPRPSFRARSRPLRHTVKSASLPKVSLLVRIHSLNVLGDTLSLMSSTRVVPTLAVADGRDVGASLLHSVCDCVRRMPRGMVDVPGDAVVGAQSSTAPWCTIRPRVHLTKEGVLIIHPGRCGNEENQQTDAIGPRATDGGDGDFDGKGAGNGNGTRDDTGRGSGNGKEIVVVTPDMSSTPQERHGYFQIVNTRLASSSQRYCTSSRSKLLASRILDTVSRMETLQHVSITSPERETNPANIAPT